MPASTGFPPPLHPSPPHLIFVRPPAHQPVGRPGQCPTGSISSTTSTSVMSRSIRMAKVQLPDSRKAGLAAAEAPAALWVISRGMP
jgi:hypothetical protein